MTDPRTAEERLLRDIEYVLMRFVNLPFEKQQAIDCRDALLHVFRAALAAEPVPAPLDVELRAAAQEWADLCHDYDLNERGQDIMLRLRRALATPPEPTTDT